jgi:polysaccharide chain length determinant protein (PEP-CTERM system associated)
MLTNLSNAEGDRPRWSRLSMVRMLWKQKLLIVAVWVVLSGTAVVVVDKLPAVYKAETLILVDSQKIPEKYVSATVNTETQDRLATISQQIMSATRLQKIMDDFGLYREQRARVTQEEIVERMRKDIGIKLEKGWSHNRTGAFRVSYQGGDPALVAEVANRLANLYIEENLRAREVQAEGTSDFIETQLEQAKKALDELEARVSQYKQQHSGELPQQENSLIATLARLQVQLQGNQDAINRIQQDKLMLDNALSMAESSEATLAQVTGSVAEGAPAGVAKTATGAVPKKRSDALREHLELLRARYSEDHPEVKRVAADLAEVREMEERRGAEAALASAEASGGSGEEEATESGTSVASKPAPVSPAVSAGLLRERERIAMLKTRLTLANRQLEAHTNDRQRILQQIASVQSRVERLPVREQEMAGLVRDYEISKLNYKSLLEKKLSAEMATELERRQKSERFTVLDPARVPEKSHSPNRPLLKWLGCALGLVLGLAGGLGREMTKNTILGEWELPPGTLVLGRVPRIGSAS